MLDEGIIKFDAKWIRSNIEVTDIINEMNSWRKKLYNEDLIGQYSNGIGFGNISIKIKHSDDFLISGSGTGTKSFTGSQDYTKVISYDFDTNRLTCVGPIIASSESLTHAVLYEVDPSIQVVIHGHHPKLWEDLLNKIPTTSEAVPYGTPEMAYETMRLFKETNVAQHKLFAMGGHPEGIVSFGANFDEAYNAIASYY
jgi:L-ribulose-5-phosphate 4-epimerase